MEKEQTQRVLTDPFGRRIEYVRLSVTDQCDLRCFYCMPKGFNDYQEPGNWLTFDEIERVMRAFSELGTRRVRITGGEPLIRKNLPRLASQLHRIPGISDLSLSTNATRLNRQSQALKDAGISRMNVSLDTLNPERFKDITGGKLEKVLSGLMAAKEAGFKPVKINMVLMRGINDDEIEGMVEFCIEHDFTLRFIETMPMGNTGRSASKQYIDLGQVRKRLEKSYSLIDSTMPGGGPARYVKIGGTDLRIGFITPISQHFCETCNRVRLSAEGTLYMCLGQSHSYQLRPLLRNGATDEELKEAICQAIAMKPERHEFIEKPQQSIRFMSVTGG
ncbi:MAG TPA: GTP 3',8-cyclase MoaA [Gammaproteobacteria bacterium]|nr:GTP 3',8-cyclase MoaA [Gammaproteobacteria bacterium]